MSDYSLRREKLIKKGNPFLSGPCFSPLQDHRFCCRISSKWPMTLPSDRVDAEGGPVHYVDVPFTCPCPCGHPEPPADAKPGKDMDRVRSSQGDSNPSPVSQSQ